MNYVMLRVSFLINFNFWIWVGYDSGWCLWYIILVVVGIMVCGV